MNAHECRLAGPHISRGIAHVLKRLHCHGAPVYAMIDLQRFDLSVSSVHRLFTVSMPFISVYVLLTKHVVCLRVSRVATQS